MMAKKNVSFQPIAVEEFMSRNEQKVELIFAESGVHPMTLGELLEISSTPVDSLLKCELNYPEVNGFRELRKVIASMYDEIDPDRVLVTVGASEANFIVSSALLKRGDHVAVMQPTYQQFQGNAKNLGCEVSCFHLIEKEGRYALDVDSVRRAIQPNTKIVALVNPNNPTGYILTKEEMAFIVDVAKEHNCFLLTDEVYSGAETEGTEETPSFYQMYDKCIAVNSMSKAYGIPGLRLGWLISRQKDAIETAWRHHEYVTISTSMLSNKLALAALSARAKIIERSRRLIRYGWPLVEETVEKNSDILSVVGKPGASAMCFLRYSNVPIDSAVLALRLVQERSMLVVPGIHFGKEYHIRFTYALPTEMVKEGLHRLVSLLRTIQKEVPKASNL